jgi:lysophospholipase L1-like esterase
MNARYVERDTALRSGFTLATRPAVRVAAALLVLLAFLFSGCAEEERGLRAQGIAPLYVAIGASESVGTGARDPSAEGWVAQLHRRMPAGTRLANLGIGGLRARQAVEQVLPVAADLQPTVVTVWLAVNDLTSGVPLDAYRADLDLLLETLRRETRARIYVANIPDLTALPAFQEQDAAALVQEVQRWNIAIAASVEAHGAVLVDLFTGWQELHQRPDYVSRDGLHPSPRGHRRLAEIFWSAMQGA